MTNATRRTSLRQLTVRRKPACPARGWLIAGPLALPVALGRAGIKANKREGDGATPRGAFRLTRLWWRADRHPRPATNLPVRRIGASDGWCEDPTDRRYNRPVTLVPQSNADRLKRQDNLVRLYCRDRPQYAPAHRRPRQRRVYPCRRGRDLPRPRAASRSSSALCGGCWRGSARERGSWLSNRYRAAR